MSSAWYLDEQLWQDFYHCMFSPADFQRAGYQVAALLNLLGQMPQTVLDLGCGPGRHSLPLARSGCAVTAIDTSTFLLQRLHQHLQDHNAAEQDDLSINIEQVDMRTFSQPAAFDLVVCLWSSFGYFDTPEDNLRVLQQSHANLCAGGRLVIDVAGKEILLRQLQPVHADEFDDGSLLITRPAPIDNMTRMEVEWLLVRADDSVARTQFTHFIYSTAELQQMLQQTGFSNIQFYGDWDGCDYDLDAERLIVVAQKP